MKKLILSLLTIGTLGLLACSEIKHEPIVKDPNDEEIQKTFTYENDKFKMTLPADYTQKDNNIMAKQAAEFPEFRFESSIEANAIKNLPELEKNRFANLCKETDTCGKIINSQLISIDGKTGMKFTVQYKGRSLEDRRGYLNEYHYSILNGNNQLFRFLTSANDLENLVKISKEFDEIVQTLEFK